MPATREDFDSYAVFYYTDRPFAPFPAMIYCYRDDRQVGRVVFYPDGEVPMTQEGSLHYPFSRFRDVITILESGKPTHISWNSYVEEGEEVIWGTLAATERESEDEPHAP